MPEKMVRHLCSVCADVLRSKLFLKMVTLAYKAYTLHGPMAKAKDQQLMSQREQ
jgi:hypothetical protein